MIYNLYATLIDYYSNYPNKIHTTTFHNISYDTFIHNSTILPEAIDFHCFPEIITLIQKKTKLPFSLIKEYIWNCHSGYNKRKQFTIDAVNKYTSNYEWKIIEPLLIIIRSEIVL